MQSLHLVSKSPAASWYAVDGDHDGPVERFVVSTPGTRRICNEADLLGVDFNVALQQAMTGALASAPFGDFLRGTPEARVCVVNFLRGGLNFELRRALHDAYGFNRHSSAFMSSQRQRIDGRWSVREDMYRKLDIPSDAVLVLGDVVATGVTLANGFDVLVDHVASSGSSLRGIVLFTIGCHKAEKVLAEVDAKARAAFPGYERTVLVYLEGKFRLVDSKSELRIGIPGTDLIRPGALLPPELVLSQYRDPAFTLERCAIYDAGSRAFDILRYVQDVEEYWAALRELAAAGLTLRDALLERWPDGEWSDPAAFDADADAWWRGVDAELRYRIQVAHRERWTALRGDAGGAAALVGLCDARLATLRAVLAGAA